MPYFITTYATKSDLADLDRIEFETIELLNSIIIYSKMSNNRQKNRRSFRNVKPLLESFLKNLDSRSIIKIPKCSSSNNMEHGDHSITSIILDVDHSEWVRDRVFEVPTTRMSIELEFFQKS